MAKYEQIIHGNFDEVLEMCEHAILDGSVSASYEDGSNYDSNGVRVAVRVYERYSAFGGNRVSLNLTLMGNGNDEIFLSAITSGGSQAIFFKMNTIGEESFLDTLKNVVEKSI